MPEPVARPFFAQPHDGAVYGSFMTEPLKRPVVFEGKGPELRQLNKRMGILERSQKRRGVDLPKQAVPVRGGILTEVRIARTVVVEQDVLNLAEAAFFEANGPFLVCYVMANLEGAEPGELVYKADPDDVIFALSAHHQPVTGFRVGGAEIFDASDDEAVFLVLTNQHGVSRLMTGHGLAPFIQPPQDGEICS